MAGLSHVEAAERLARSGPNELPRAAAPSRLWSFFGQFKSPMIRLLLAATVLAAALGEVTEAVAIGAVVLLNGLVGFVQEDRARRAVLALRALTAPKARVLRDGRSAVVPAAEVVPGDLLLVEAGDVVAADARLIEAHGLKVNEAALTGESAPVEKSARAVPAGSPLAERTDHVFLGTPVVAGTGLAEVEHTGARTEMGRIAGLLAQPFDELTPLQRRLDSAGRKLMIGCLGVVAVVAAISLARGAPALEVLLEAVSLAVAAVPESLAAIVTIALAVGVQRMAGRHALVRHLPAVETLGAVTVICTDKTGTLTVGQMRVRELWGPDPGRLLYAAAACCDAELTPTGEAGDPTEVALLRAAAAQGVRREEIEAHAPRTEVLPFDADRKWMAVRRADGLWYLKGAAEAVLARCRDAPPGSASEGERLASRGLRVLAVASGRSDGPEALELLGLVGLADPPRPEAVAAVAEAKGAGIWTVMITGDHPATARAIAAELGLLDQGRRPEDVVHARATAQQKLEIVRNLKARGEVVAMTGDGVNDAPALREAHVGIAMGRTGTELTREVADVVLSDDNYASIVAAVREGRGIYDNIQKTLAYLLTGNSGQLALMLAAAVGGLAAPVLPLQLLWINLVVDGLTALSLSLDPVAGDALGRPPRAAAAPILDGRQWRRIVGFGGLEAAIALTVFAASLEPYGLAQARTMGFSTLVFSELFRAFAARSPSEPIWRLGLRSNLRLSAVVAASVALQIALVSNGAGKLLLGAAPVSGGQIGVALLAGLVPFALAELGKVTGTLWRRQRPTAADRRAPKARALRAPPALKGRRGADSA